MPSNKQTFQLTITFCFTIAILFIVSISQAARIDRLLEEAGKGSAKEQAELGVAYELGKGVEKDPELAASWSKVATTGLEKRSANRTVCVVVCWGIERPPGGLKDL